MRTRNENGGVLAWVAFPPEELRVIDFPAIGTATLSAYTPMVLYIVLRDGSVQELYDATLRHSDEGVLICRDRHGNETKRYEHDEVLVFGNDEIVTRLAAQIAWDASEGPQAQPRAFWREPQAFDQFQNP